MCQKYTRMKGNNTTEMNVTHITYTKARIIIVTLKITSRNYKFAVFLDPSSHSTYGNILRNDQMCYVTRLS